MPRYRVGGSWKTHTIILEGSEPADEKGRRPDDLPVAWVDSAAPARLAERIAALLSDVCNCGHEGLDAMFHVTPCPVAELKVAARRLGYHLALVPREDA